jgi:hypothetical protein
MRPPPNLVSGLCFLEYLVSALCKHHSSQFACSPRRGAALRKVLHFQSSNEAVWGRPMAFLRRSMKFYAVLIVNNSSLTPSLGIQSTEIADVRG